MFQLYLFRISDKSHKIMSFFNSKIYLFILVRVRVSGGWAERDGETSGLPPEGGARCEAQSQDPEIMT